MRIKNDILFVDGSRVFDLKLYNRTVPDAEISQTPSTLLINPGGGRFGSKDPTFSEYEQETWNGGALGEYYHDDQTNYMDSSGVNTRFPKKLFLNSLWKLATGIRTREQYMPGSVSWQALFGSFRVVAVQLSGSGTYDFANLLIRRRGAPGALTFEIRADSGGSPGTTAVQTVTATTADITDVLTQFYTFNWTGTQACNQHWLVVYGASTDNAESHWELGVDISATGGKYISDPAGTSWNTATFKPYYFISDADSDVKWHKVQIGSNLYIINQPSSGNSVIKLWNETTKAFDAVSPTGSAISGQCTSATVINGLGWLAFGNANPVMQFDHNGGAPRLYADAAVKADLITNAMHPSAGSMLFTANNDTWAVRRFAPVAYGANLAAAGDTWNFGQNYNIIGLAAVGQDVVVRQTYGLFKITYNVTLNNEVVVDLNSGLRSALESATYVPILNVGDLFFYPNQFSLIKSSLNSGAHQDIGLWRGSGVPDGRQGVVSSMCIGAGEGIYVGVDAGTGVSSVWFYDFVAWHEVWRAWKAGIRVRNIFWQPQTSTTPARLFINAGNDLVYIDQPDNSPNPQNDADTQYLWEGYVTSTIHDFDTFQLKKLFEYMDVISRNLGNNVTVEIDYQTDRNIGTETWIPNAARLVSSPRSRAKLAVGDAYLIRYRLRLLTSTKSTSPLIRAVIMAGVARTPLKRQWNLTIPIGSGQPDYKYDTLYDWFLDASRGTNTVRMYSGPQNMDNISVLIQPPRLIPTAYNKSTKRFDGNLQVTVLEVETREDVKY